MLVYLPIPCLSLMLTMCTRCVSFGLMAAALGPMIVLVNRTPDHIPADVIAAEQEKRIDGASVKEPVPSTVYNDLKV